MLCLRLSVRPHFTWTTVVLLFTGVSAFAQSHSSQDLGAEGVGLFQALADQQVAATLIPRDSKRVTLKLANQSGKPLTIRLPAAFAGKPALAQFQQGNQNLFGQNGGGQNNGGGNQAVGIGGAQQGNQNGGNNNNLFQGLFFVPPGKEIKVKMRCVCLEFGKPDPNPRIAYEVCPLENVCSDEKVRAALALLGRGAVSQRVTQLAAWHLANGKSWQELAALEYHHAGGRVSPQFRPAELAKAQKLVELIEEKSGAEQLSKSG